MNVEIEADFLAALSNARGRLTQDQIDLLVALCVAPHNEATATQLAPLFGYTGHAPVNSLMARLARVLANGGIEPPKREDGSIRWWQVVATGWRRDAGNLPWKLRPGWRDAAIQLGMVPGDAGLFPEVVAPDTPLLEGAVTRVTANAYERNPVARRRCIEHPCPCASGKASPGLLRNQRSCSACVCDRALGNGRHWGGQRMLRSVPRRLRWKAIVGTRNQRKPAEQDQQRNNVCT